ncbi:hypothetical protein [Sinorhizobium medicae]|uniref:hypothetical protein n=1 Tax=Sinorhizobium medicae TaxID=110321 RepID=UPI000462CFC0|nr:hypothetical protein [Sinorhizobium medicae]RVQ66640.1 hypothetical protein CN244_19260 [Sinorhizobium medicae]
MNAAAFIGFLLLQPVNKCLSGPFDLPRFEMAFPEALASADFQWPESHEKHYGHECERCTDH